MAATVGTCGGSVNGALSLRAATLMTTILVMDSLPLATVKASLSSVVDRVEGTHERVTITRNGRAVAVLISPEDLEALEETVEILSDAKAMRRIRQGLDEVARGDVVDEAGLRDMVAASRLNHGA